MKRRTLDLTLATVGLVVAIVMAIAGGILLYAANFTQNTVTDELTAQQIYFPPADQLASPELQNLQQYAGQQVTTGALAKSYSDMIAVHLEGVAGGKTYSQVSSEYIASNSDPTKRDPALAAQRQTLFMGETLRGLLLNTYAFSIFGTIAFIAGWVALGASVALLVLAGIGWYHGRHVDASKMVGAPSVESIPA
ncbi:MAG: hypothetical protein GC157_03250 [Frankiales bacterium]|nr:hypothetical protein [Frankiales bacterium]